jgi:phage-related protein
MGWTLLQCDGRLDSFLADIGKAAEARVWRDLLKLQDRGYNLRPPHTDSLGDQLFELRTQHRGNIYRNIFIYRSGEIIILESFVKKTQKTPKRHIDDAKQRRDHIDAGGIELSGIIPS